MRPSNCQCYDVRVSLRVVWWCDRYGGHAVNRLLECVAEARQQVAGASVPQLPPDLLPDAAALQVGKSRDHMHARVHVRIHTRRHRWGACGAAGGRGRRARQAGGWGQPRPGSRNVQTRVGLANA
jgi:hypothetical protein